MSAPDRIPVGIWHRRADGALVSVYEVVDGEVRFHHLHPRTLAILVSAAEPANRWRELWVRRLEMH